MKRLWECVADRVTPGVRLLLGLMVVLSLVELVGILTSTFTLVPQLALNGPAFWHGQVWQVLTYPLLPASLVAFVINGLVIVWLGGALERRWFRREFWAYCVVVTVGAGLVKVLIQPAAASTLVGSMPLVLGLLVAWMRCCRTGSFSLRSVLDSPIQGVACLLAGASFFISVMNAGFANAVVMLAGGLIGWCYVSIRRRSADSRANQALTSERMTRLEL
jgi:membrane associated rhomboid family serine protease